MTVFCLITETPCTSRALCRSNVDADILTTLLCNPIENPTDGCLKVNGDQPSNLQVFFYFPQKGRLLHLEDYNLHYGLVGAYVD
jgi:hypothetical protein